MAVPTNANVSEQKLFIVNKVQLMMILLSIQFMLGMGLNLIDGLGTDISHHVRLFWDMLLVLHITNAFVMMGLGIVVLNYSIKNFQQTRKPTTIALVGIVLAIIGGSLTANHFHEELMSFFMATSFLVAVTIYGRILSKLGPQ